MALRVQHLEWMSEEAQEACLDLSDGELCIRAFAQPCPWRVGDVVEELSAVLVGPILSSTQTAARMVSLRHGFEAEINAFVLSVKPPVVGGHQLRISLDAPLPGDIEPGQWVSFSCGRLDV